MPNVLLRGESVVLAFPYDGHIVEAVRRIPGRRFDWDAREWLAPVDDRVAVHVADVVARYRLSTSDAAAAWLREVGRRWVADVTTCRHDGTGHFVVRTHAGEAPPEIGAAALVPMTPATARALRAQRSALLDDAAARCVAALTCDLTPPPARLVLADGVEGERLRVEVLWDHDAGAAFAALPGAAGARGVVPDPWIVEQVDAFVARHGVDVRPRARELLERLRAERAEAATLVGHSRARHADPIDGVHLGGRPTPFQWAAVRYALQTRRTFLADEQGLGKTVEALATLEADGAFPAIVVCPASLKLNWERETRTWLPHRSVAVIEGRVAVPPRADVAILNYEIVAAHVQALARRRPRALVVDESHYCKNPRAKRTQAVRRLATGIDLRLALTGTPVLNHPEELVSQLRVLGRLEHFGSGARFARLFEGERSEERLHWHLRRHCFVRRRKAEVLRQLPAKRRVVVPVALSNEREYALAERSVIDWLREQPLDLHELDARVAAALRAERLAQLGVLQRIAARGKLAAALQWIEDFGEPLVVFARHRECQRALLDRFPGALHLLGSDGGRTRDDAVRAFQRPDGPRLLVCATRAAAHGITLTRASNVAFLELEWTPALLEQAEDRCHRIGQRDAVTAWYLLAAGTIDETMATLIERKRALVGAVTDGRRADADGLVEGVVRSLRDRPPLRHLRAVV